MKTCPNLTGSDLFGTLQCIGQLWFDSNERPKIAEPVQDGWDKLLLDWICDSELPLIVRSSKSPPGLELRHSSGRILIASDNSPASWALTLAERGEVPTLNEVRQFLSNDLLPFAMAIKAANRERTKYICNLASLCDNPNARGWKVGHIISVGMKVRGNLTDYPMSTLAIHFLNLLSPRNMYVVPKAWAGLSEIEPVNDVFKSRIGNAMTQLHQNAMTLIPSPK